MLKNETLLVSFYGGIDRFQVAESQVYRSLQQFTSVSVLRCAGQFRDICPYIRLHHKRNALEENNGWICKICIAKSKTWSTHLEMSEVVLDDYLDSFIKRELRQFKISLPHNSYTFDPQEIFYEDIPIGSFALYDLMVNHRIN